MHTRALGTTSRTRGAVSTSSDAQREQRGHAQGAVLTALVHARTCMSTCMRERLCEGRRDKAGRRRALTAAQRHDISNIKTLNRPSGSKPREARSDRKCNIQDAHTAGHHASTPGNGEQQHGHSPVSHQTVYIPPGGTRTPGTRAIRRTHRARAYTHRHTHKREPARTLADITSRQGNSQQGAQ